MEKFKLNIEIPFYENGRILDAQSIEIIKHTFKNIGGKFISQIFFEKQFPGGKFYCLEFEFESKDIFFCNNLTLGLKND